MEALREAWFDAPDLATQQKICRDMQQQFWQNPSYVPFGMYDQPTAFHTYLQEVRDGWPQFSGHSSMACAMSNTLSEMYDAFSG
jgi:peptide/nickel transport system substrate-binding protein